MGLRKIFYREEDQIRIMIHGREGCAFVSAELQIVWVRNTFADGSKGFPWAEIQAGAMSWRDLPRFATVLDKLTYIPTWMHTPEHIADVLVGLGYVDSTIKQKEVA